MTWAYLIVMVVVLILGIALAPKAQGPNAAEIDDFDFPTAEEGRPIPVVFGEVDIRGSNVLWYGDLRVQAIKKRSGFSKSTVGHKYYIGWHAGLCHGPVDLISNILVGEKQAWSGSATGNTTIGINQPDLFGGEKREGGISGSVDICMGGPAQTANSYLSTKLASAYPGIPVTAFRGITCIVAKQMYIGTSAYPKVWAVRTRRILSGWQDDLVWYDTKATIDTRHMNPAHIVYQCLTDTRWGMGVDYSLIDTDSFEAVADQLHTENFGLSLIWNQSESIEKFLQIILDHIAGGLTLNNSTGKYEMLLVRGDYDIETLETYDEDDIVRVNDYQRQGWGETVNEVTLVYTDPRTLKDTTISQQDLANIDAQGARIPQIIKLKGIQNHEVAKTVLARELVSRVTPLSKVVFEINRRAWATRYGGLFKMVYSPRNINGIVYRVLKVSKGTITKNTIKIEALEDIYALGVNSSLGTPSDPPDDESPPATPSDATDTGVNVISSSETTPPVTPADGDSYFIPGDGTATGVWAGHEGQVADYDLETDEWIFTDVPDNTLIFDEDTNTWQTIVGGVPEDAPWTLPLTTKGDIVVHNGTNLVRFPVGADGQTITADSSTATGLAWDDGGGGSGALAYSQTRIATNSTVANSTSENLFPDIYQIAAGSMSDEGSTIESRFYGVVSTAGSGPTLRWRLKFGSTTILDSGAVTLPASLTNVGWVLDATIVSTSAGNTVEAQGQLRIAGEAVLAIAPTAPVSVDLTVTQNFTLSVQWGTADAANTTTMRVMTVRKDAAVNVSPVPGGGSDPDFANVVALLPLDSDLLDVKGHTFTANGSVAISSTQSKFGGASMRCPGSGSYLLGASNTDFGLGTGDYTLEFWVRMDAVSGTQVLFDMRPFGSGGAGPMCTLVGSRFDFYLNSAYRVQAGTCVAGTWHHVALCRASATTRAFIDGVQIGSNYTDSNNYPSSQNVILARFSDSGSFAPTCYIDDFRLTKGVARYTANFTPPSSANPTS